MEILSALIVLLVIAVIVLALANQRSANAHARFCERLTTRAFDSASTVITEELEARRIAKPFPPVIGQTQPARPNTDFIGEPGAFPENAYGQDGIVAGGGGTPN